MLNYLQIPKHLIQNVHFNLNCTEVTKFITPVKKTNDIRAGHSRTPKQLLLKTRTLYELILNKLILNFIVSQVPTNYE